MSHVHVDDEAVLWSASAADREGRPLLLLLHGYNSNEGDLFSVAPYLPLEPAIASLRGPHTFDYGYGWFPRVVDDTTGDVGFEGATDTADAILGWLDRVAPDVTSVGLLGFSQGAAMAIELLRRAPDRFAFLVNLGGFALGGERAGDERMSQLAPPVFWGRGAADEVVPARMIEHTQMWLPAHSTLDERIYEGIGHSVSDRELADVAAFIRARYAPAA